MSFFDPKGKNKTAEQLGKQGEDLIAKELKLADRKGYHGFTLRKVYLPKDDGTTSEIDLVYITTRGLIVIESKNYSGYIFGKESDLNWTATLYAGKRVDKNRFYNPVLQNRTHIKYIRDYLSDDHIPIFSIIVFSERCVLKDISITSHNLGICNIDCLHEYIEQIWQQASVRLSEDQTKELFDRLLPLTKVTRAEKRQHIEAIRSKYHGTK